MTCLSRSASILILLATSLALVGCSPFTRDPSGEAIYRLTPDALPREVLNSLPRPLSLDRVTVPAALDNNDIRLSRGKQRVDYYANARWAAPLPDTLTDAIAHLLGDTAIAEDPQTTAQAGHYRLRVRARDFQAHYRQSSDKEPPQLRVTLVLSLLDAGGGIVARTRVDQRDDAKADRLDSIVTGLEDALRTAMRRGLNDLTADQDAKAPND